MAYSLSSVKDTVTKNECPCPNLARELDYSGSGMEPGSAVTPPVTLKVRSIKQIHLGYCDDCSKLYIPMCVCVLYTYHIQVAMCERVHVCMRRK